MEIVLKGISQLQKTSLSKWGYYLEMQGQTNATHNLQSNYFLNGEF